MKLTFTLAAILFSYCFASAQFTLECSGRDQHAVYLSDYNGNIYRVDSVDGNPGDTIAVAFTGTVDPNGISINKDLNGGSGNDVMYIAPDDYVYSYWNGTTWTNTNYNSGSVNPGGSSRYIFNLDGIGGILYRYDGSGNATTLITNLNTIGGTIFDVACDRAGNFYIYYDYNQQVIAYTEDGIEIDTLSATTTSPMAGQGGTGLAILGNRMYYTDQNDDLYEGVITGRSIQFTFKKSIGFEVGDIAACAEAGEVLAVPRQPEMPRFAVYPNPASTVATVATENVETIQVFDYTGKEKIRVNTSNAPKYQLSMEGWSAGLYLVVATSVNGQTVRQILTVQ